MAITGGIGTKAVMRRYPVADGLTAETTSQVGHKENLTYQKSFISQRQKVGIE